MDAIVLMALIATICTWLVTALGAATLKVAFRDKVVKWNVFRIAKRCDRTDLAQTSLPIYNDIVYTKCS